MGAIALTAVEIFCSYAHEDEMWLRKLEVHLSQLKQQGLISLWHDRLIIPGTNWAKDIDTHLETASVILLLVSADFFASDYCVGVEMKRALERQEEGAAVVIPILVSEVNWSEAPFMHLQALPTDAKPLTIWSNEETALADVAAGIRRAIEELPLLVASAPRAALPPIWNVPYPRNPFFLGRETELALVRQNLQAGQATALSQPQAINGLGGIGKTQLALEYAYRFHQNYRVVLWVRAESTEALISSYIALAILLRLPEREAREQDIIVQAVKTWLQTHRDWLLILDNADELALLPDFLPPTPGGHLLLTTRATATERLASRMEIETLQPEQGALLLLRRSGLIVSDAELSQASIQERELALQITQELGGLPLALDQAGAYLEATGTDLANYWQIYQQHRTSLLQERRGLIRDHPAPVTTTWSLSFQLVEEKNPAAAELLHLCAYLAPDAIAEEILTAGASLLGPVLAPVAVNAFQFNQAIEVLRAYSLMRRNPKEKTLSIHRLMQAVIQDTLEETERHIWAERAMLSVNAVFPHVEQDVWLQCERLLPQAMAVAQWVEQYQLANEEAGRLIHETASYLQSRARYIEAERFYQHALSFREKVLGSEHPQVASLLNGLADLYTEQGKYTEAEPLHQQALRIREQVLGPEHPDLAESLDGLGCFYTEQGKYTEAEPFYQQALRIREQAEHSLVAQPLHNLAFIYYKQGRYVEAEPLYQHAADLLEQAKNPHVAYPLDGLANLYRKQGRYTEAESFYQRALHIREQTLGPEHPLVACPLDGLADLYTEQGKYAEAEPLYQHALRILEHALRSEHPYVAYPLTGLANLYRKQGRYAEAEPLYQRALYIREQALGPEHPETAEVIYNIAIFQEAQGSKDLAKSSYDRALTVRKQMLGEHHPNTTETRKHLIVLLHALELHEQAAQLELAQAGS